MLQFIKISQSTFVNFSEIPAAAQEAIENSNVEGAPDAANEPPATYDDLFPSLPSAAPARGGRGGAPGSSGPPIGDWNRKPMLMSSTVTTVIIDIHFLSFFKSFDIFTCNYSNCSSNRCSENTCAF